jgi:trehalose 6-phosphate synthase
VEDSRSGLLRELIGDRGRLIVVSNRGPITFARDDSASAGLTAARGSGGLVTALGELGRHAPITWVAASLTEGDRDAARVLNGHGGDGTRKDGPQARRVRELVSETLSGQDIELRYVHLSDEVYDRHYRVVSNPFLWFVQHEMYANAYGPNIDAGLLDAWRHGYRPANVRLADAAVEAAGSDERPVILLQDYHLYLAAARIRERLPHATILHFNHIPWPAESQWRLIPQGMRRAICEGLLACDIVGLQTDRYASHFLDSVASFVREARVDRAGRNVAWRDRRIRVRAYPISIDPDGLLAFSRSDAVQQRLERLTERLDRAGNPRLIVRADRIEPSKNALRGFLALEILLERRPELRKQVRFLAVQAPTRTEIPEYAEYAAAVREVVARLNGMAEPDDQPVWIYDGSDYAMAIAALRIADVVLVNPLVDGMNLVAKEAVLVGENDPALVLSETAGAAEQLAADSLTVAPADVVGTAAALDYGLTMPAEERRARLRRMRSSVRQEDLDWWLTRQLRDLAALRRGVIPPSRRLRDTVRRVESEAV